MDIITTPAAVYSPPNTAILHNTAASLTDRSPTAPVHLVQYDQAVPVIAVSLTEKDSQYTVPSGAAVNVRMDKPDGKHVYDPALGISEDGKTVYIGVTAQMTAAWGRSNPIVEIVIDGGIVGTAAFPVIIDQNPVPDSAYESTDEYLTLYEILQQAQNAAQIVQQNAQNLQNLTDNLEAVQNAAANAQAAAASAQAAQKAAQEALGFRTFFSAITPDTNGNLDPSRPMTTPSAQASWTIESRGDRIQSVQVNGFAQQAGTGDPSPANVRGITVAAQDKTLPVTLTGHKTVTETLSLTLPLCNGDTVESCVLSGCDKKIVLDGSGYWQATGSNGQYYSDIMADPVASNTVLGYVFSDTLHRDTAANGYTGTVCICVNQNGNICVTLPGGASPASYFMEHPAIVYYRSSAYTEAADIQVQFESHQNGYAVFTGGASESWTQERTRFWTSVQGASLDSARKSVLCSVGVFNASASTTSFVCFVSGGKFFFYPDQSQSWTVQSFKSWLSGLSSAGTPMQVVYPLATTEVYARDPVTLVAVPYTSADVAAANQLASTPSTLPAIDGPDVPMLLDAAEPEQAAPAVLAANAIPVAGTYVISSQDNTTVLVSLKAFQDGGDAATLGGLTAEDIKNETFAAVDPGTAETLLAVIVGHSAPGAFTVGTASNYSDMPASIVGGYSANGIFFPASNSDQDFAVFLWQVRNAEPEKACTMWFRTIANGAWNGTWMKTTATAD